MLSLAFSHLNRQNMALLAKHFNLRVKTIHPMKLWSMHFDFLVQRFSFLNLYLANSLCFFFSKKIDLIHRRRLSHFFLRQIVNHMITLQYPTVFELGSDPMLDRIHLKQITTQVWFRIRMQNPKTRIKSNRVSLVLEGTLRNQLKITWFLNLFSKQNPIVP